MSAEGQLRVGLIGLGQMGRNHLRVLSMLKGVSLAFLHDRDEEAGRALAAAHGAPFRGDIEAALGEADAVVICTPTMTHDDYVRLAAGNVRNIFVEKPLTDTLESSERLRDFARERGLHVQVGFIERFNPAVQQLDALLRDADRVVSVDFARTNRLSRINDVDVIIDLMIHDVDLALHLNGPVASVSAHGVVDRGMIAFASANLVHENGRFSRIQASRITDKKMRVIQATCSDMFVNCELLRKEIVISRQAAFGERAGSPLVITAVEETVAVRPEEALLAELRAFVANSREPGSVEAPGVDAAVSAMAVCDAIQRDVRREAPQINR
jgi:predicted dehydrogenase